MNFELYNLIEHKYVLVLQIVLHFLIIRSKNYNLVSMYLTYLSNIA